MPLAEVSMSRRRTPRRTVSDQAPKDGSALGHLSDADLVKELARRRVTKGQVDLGAIETLAEEVQRGAAEETLKAAIEALPPEDATPKPCPKCGKRVPVKARNRPRHILTIAGELRLSRNYHHCDACNFGFYPRDRELNLPEKGDVSDAMERRILDFGVNDTFGSAAERWSIHYPFSISSNLVRRVVDRVGERQDAPWSELTLQQAYRPTPEELPESLVIAGDGSMLLTREDAWREVKVAVVARGEDFHQQKTRRSVEEARYVAEFSQADFRKSLKAALEAERADEVQKVVWLGDGAPENWKMANELCPLAIQVLDLPHAIQNGVACGKAILGEGDPGLPLWGERLKQLLNGPSPDAAIRELLECLPYTENDEQLAALDDLIGYYRTNEKRMRYSLFREMGLPIGSGIVESAHRHVLQDRMKRAGQRWSLLRARRMARLRAAYRTAGPRRFHAAIREGQRAPPPMKARRTLPNGVFRAKHRYTPSRVSPRNRTASN
jgi:hypothetical protein